jgi:hypothetical protein
MPKCSAYKFFQKPNYMKFDQVCRKNLNICNTIRFIMMYIFIWNRFGVVDINNFFNKLGQTLHRLTLKKLICTTSWQGGSIQLQ